MNVWIYAHISAEWNFFLLFYLFHPGQHVLGCKVLGFSNKTWERGMSSLEGRDASAPQVFKWRQNSHVGLFRALHHHIRSETR